MPLKDLLKARFTTALDSVPKGTWKILITDDHSQALLDTVYKNFDILQQNVTSVEPLHSPRQPMGVEAIYLLTPTSQNVDRVIADFSMGRRTYKAAHLFFIDGISDYLAQKLTGSLPGDVLKAFTELYCNFWALEDRIFSLKTPSSFFTMFGNIGSAAAADLAMEAFEDDVQMTSRTMLNLLATLNENPHIRYYQPHHHSPLGALANQQASSSSTLSAPPPQQTQSLRWRSAMGEPGQQQNRSGSPGQGGPAGPGSQGGGAGMSRPAGPEHLSGKIARQIQADLDEYMANNPDFPTASSRPKAVLFVVDRSMDPVAPFLHEFWYQAMVNDLLKVEDGVRYKYKYTNTVGGTENKEAELTDDDPVWCSVRHLHMKDAIDRLMMDFNKFAQEHAGFSDNGGQVGVNDLKDMLASLPQFQTQREQYSLHLDMAQECMGLFEKKHLNLAANVEQCCATGYTSEGKPPKNLVEEMVPLLDDRALGSLDKVRIIALYILFREGVADEDRRRLFQHARLSLSEQDSVNNLVWLGAKVIKDAKDKSNRSRLKQKYHASEGEFELSRFRPIAQMVLEDSHYNRLDPNHFPYTRPPPSDASGGASGSLRSGGRLAPGGPASRGPPPGSSGSLRSARPTWHKAPSARATNTEGKQRMILFVAGGVTYGEMRLAYTIGQTLGKEIYIGSTHIITPESFVRDLKSLGRGGIGCNPPNGIAEHPQSPGRGNRTPGRAVTYQQILDRRYWQPPVGPPPLAPPPGSQSQQQQQQQQQRPAGPAQTNSFNGAANLNTQMGNLTMNGKEGKDSRLSLGKLGGGGGKEDKDKDKKKSFLGKMKW